ncbi:MAG TPA: ADP-ribosylglycohydrolase family protein [Actinomycetes bacterium]|nr:ADP-ribosylglycohydrolase family protein [Actinomycetes bacterium]
MSDRPSPDGVAPTPQHIRAGIVAYAAGDALGVPWEGSTPEEVRWEALEGLPARGDWPRGATSDDTAQLLLVAEYLVEANGQVDERDFLARLAKALSGMRGAGPTTQAAVRRFLATGELQATDGASIGAAMRALPFGWATPVAAAAHRRELTIRLSRTTHGDPEAIISACVVAEMAAWAIEQHPVDAVVAAGLREAENAARQYAVGPATLKPLRRAASGDWPPNTAEPTLDALATVASVLHVLREARGLVTALKHAVALGGDTDTTAAIVGGILGCQLEDVGSQIPWLSGVGMPDAGLIEATAAGLYELRRTSH